MRNRLVVVTACALAVAGLRPAGAQEAAAPEEGPLSKLTVHGFLSQAYAWSDGGTLLGIAEEGTTDYRTAALQFRYAMTPDDDFVLQLSHERIGRNPFAQVTDDVEVDWVFYQHRFSDSLSLRAGKIKIPIGAYNEVRDVGTLLPFYRAPDSVYPVIGLVPETLTGLAVATRLAGGRFSLDADFYGGEWEFRENSPPDFRARVRDAVGCQLWLNMPLPGWRIGVGGSRGELVEVEIAPPGSVLDIRQFIASLEGKLGPVHLIAEYSDTDADRSYYTGYYGQLSWNVTDRLGAHFQHAESDLVLDLYRLPGPGPRVDLDFSRETAFGVSWAWRRDVVLKAEYHRFEGYSLSAPLPALFGPPSDIDYGIVSLSTSF